MGNRSVYLAGPITGLTYKGATDWRKSVAAELADVGITSYSPMRCKEYLDQVGTLSGHGREYGALGTLSTPRAIMTRDRFDATRCGVLFVNLLGAERVSIGTVMEIAWADLSRIPIVCAIAPQGCPHDHMMISEAIGFRVPTLEEAVAITKAILV